MMVFVKPIITMDLFCNVNICQMRKCLGPISFLYLLHNIYLFFLLYVNFTSLGMGPWRWSNGKSVPYNGINSKIGPGTYSNRAACQ